jgi:hypothetical protein
MDTLVTRCVTEFGRRALLFRVDRIPWPDELLCHKSENRFSGPGLVTNKNKKRTFLQPLSSVISCRMSESPSDLLAFEPVPSASNRHDGWTPERQRAFILALSGIGMVSPAARAVGMSRKSAYDLLKRAGPDSGFAKAWRVAVAAGKRIACSNAIERAIEGVEVPYFYRGIQRGTRRVYNDNLLIAALRYFGRGRDEGGIRGGEP